MGEEQREAFEKIKKYLMTPPVLRAPRANHGFRLYVAAQEHVIGAVLTQEDNAKEFSVAYLSRRLVGAESRYAFVEKLCLSLYYACTKLKRYLLMNHCTIICQHDVLKCMLQKKYFEWQDG
jgi:glycerol-3-phosphate dehydrogenase